MKITALPTSSHPSVSNFILISLVETNTIKQSESLEMFISQQIHKTQHTDYKHGYKVQYCTLKKHLEHDITLAPYLTSLNGMETFSSDCLLAKSSLQRLLCKYTHIVYHKH